MKKIGVFLTIIILTHDCIQTLQRARKLPIIAIEEYLFSKSSENKRKGPCSTLHTTSKQRAMCRRDPGIARALERAQKTIHRYCKELFEYDHWNCSLYVGDFSILDSLSPEHSCCTAMTAAVILYELARACGNGDMESCSCGEHKDPEVTKRLLSLGICSDNLKAALRILRNFMLAGQLNRRGYLILRHNLEVGVQILMSLAKRVCRCHGMFGSCAVKTCWRQLPTYGQYMKEIRKRCFYANIHTENNAASRNSGRKFRIAPNSPLLYVDESPDFCSMVKGRKCRDINNCATFCCGHGYNVEIVHITKICKCSFESLGLHYRTCTREEKQYICK